MCLCFEVVFAAIPHSWPDRLLDYSSNPTTVKSFCDSFDPSRVGACVDDVLTIRAMTALDVDLPADTVLSGDTLYRIVVHGKWTPL